MNRREFIKGSALAVAAAGTGCAVVPGGSGTLASDTDAARAALAEIPSGEMPLIASAPVLQNAAETSIGVSFAVSADASGWVEYSTLPDLKGGSWAANCKSRSMTYSAARSSGTLGLAQREI